MTVEIIKRLGTDLVIFPVLTLQLIDARESWLENSDWLLKYNDYWQIPIVKGRYYYPKFREKVNIRETDMILFGYPDNNKWGNGASVQHDAIQYMIDNNVLILGEGFPDASPYDSEWGFPFTINTKQNLVQVKPTIKSRY